MEKIKAHPFFKNIDFTKLEKLEVEPIFVPHIDSQLDLSNIDRFFTRENPAETPEDDSSILKKEKFDQFTYIDNNGFMMSTNVDKVDNDKNTEAINQNKNSLCDDSQFLG